MANACVTSAELVVTVPELASLAGAELDEIVATTCDMVHADIWGDKRSRAHTWLAAHYATVILNPSGAGGAVTSRTMGSISESYGTGMVEDSELASTKYGRLYLGLRKSLRQRKAHSAGTQPVNWDLGDERVH